MIRGGFGRFAQASYDHRRPERLQPLHQPHRHHDNYRTSYDTLDNPFRDGILAPTGASLGPLTNLGQGVNWNNPDPGRFHSWEYSAAPAAPDQELAVRSRLLAQQDL